MELALADTVTITSDNGREVVEVQENKNYDFKNTKRVTITFTTRNSHMGTASGFLMCYTWHEPGDSVHSDLCTSAEFEIEVDICKNKKKKQLPKQCTLRTNKKRKRKKRGKKGGKKSSKRKHKNEIK